MLRGRSLLKGRAHRLPSTRPLKSPIKHAPEDGLPLIGANLDFRMSGSGWYSSIHTC